MRIVSKTLLAGSLIAVLAVVADAQVGPGGGGGSGGSVTQGTTPWVDNITQWASTVLGAPTAWGVAPTGNVVGVNANIINANANGQATSANSAPVVIASDQSTLPVASQASATGGASTTGNIAANNTTAVVVKASAGTLYGGQLGNIGSVPAYLKIYNATSATCGSGTPVKRFIIPTASTAANGAGSNIILPASGVAFGTGITYCVTAGITDADTTAPAASTVLVNLDWK